MAIKKWNAVLRLNYQIDPETLTDDEWAKLVEEFRFANEFKNNSLKEVLIEIATLIFKND